MAFEIRSAAIGVMKPDGTIEPITPITEAIETTLETDDQEQEATYSMADLASLELSFRISDDQAANMMRVFGIVAVRIHKHQCVMNWTHRRLPFGRNVIKPHRLGDFRRYIYRRSPIEDGE